MNLLKTLARWFGCDSRWMVVDCLGYEQPRLVRHYLGKPAWGWEMFDMSGPFATEQEAKDNVSR